MSRRFLLGMIIVCVLIGCVAADLSAPHQDYAAIVMTRINALRRERDLAPLVGDEKLNAIAAAYAQELARRGTLSHTGERGDTLRDRFAAGQFTAWRAIAENLALSTTHASMLEDIVSGWRQSPGHYENLTGAAYHRSGIGYAFDAAQQHIYVVQVFAN
jgi:uncharacterized protein YkwD